MADARRDPKVARRPRGSALRQIRTRAKEAGVTRRKSGSRRGPSSPRGMGAAEDWEAARKEGRRKPPVFPPVMVAAAGSAAVKQTAQGTRPAPVLVESFD